MYTWNPYSPTGKNIIETRAPTLVQEALQSPRSSQGASDSDSVPSFSSVDVDDEAFEAFSKLRSSKKDTSVPNSLKRMPKKIKERMARLLAAFPSLVVENCVEQRGNVVSALLFTAAEPDASAIAATVADHAAAIAATKGGCIAICRVVDACGTEQQAAIAVAIMRRFVELSAHQYGNYAVQHLLKSTVSVTRATCFATAVAALRHPSALANIACNKFGSHVLETVLVEADASLFTELLVQLLGNPTAVQFLTHDDFANYAFQCALRRAIAIDVCSREYFLSVVSPHFATSRHSRNIVRALASCDAAKRE